MANREDAAFAADNLVDDTERFTDELAEPFGIRRNFVEAFTRNDRTGEREQFQLRNGMDYLVIPANGVFAREFILNRQKMSRKSDCA